MQRGSTFGAQKKGREKNGKGKDREGEGQDTGDTAFGV